MEQNNTDPKPQVQVAPSSASKSPNLGKFLNPKIIFIILGMVILGEVIWGAKTLFSPTSSDSNNAVDNIKNPANPDERSSSSNKKVSGGQIILESEKNTYKVAETVAVDVTLSTGGFKTDGTDVILKYDPAFLEPIRGDIFEKGDIYGDFPGIRSDSVKGLVYASGISTSEDGFEGDGIFGTFKFKPKKIGSTSIELLFTKDSTTDSNIIESKSAKDILNSSSSLEIIIQ